MDFSEFKENFSILIVDDNEDNVFTLHRRLQREGYKNILIAHNGKEAVEMVNNGQYKIDLILLDIMMPELDGFGVLNALKNKILAQEIRILMISSLDNIESVTECIKLGADDFLTKPFNVDILRARLGSSLEKCWHAQQVKLYQEKIEEEKVKFSELLHAVFPPAVIKELAETNTVAPRIVKNVAILFTDIVSFTNYTETHDIQTVIGNLQYFVDVCETAAAKHRIEKIKTIGDAFMAVSGMLELSDNPVLAAVKWASDVILAMKSMPLKWEVRVGIDVGDVMCGILGTRVYLFDVWGRAVNTASRIEGVAKPSSIYVTQNAWLQVEKEVKGQYVGEFSLKGKEEVTKVYEVFPGF